MRKPAGWGFTVAAALLLAAASTVMAEGDTPPEPEPADDNPWFELYPANWARAVGRLKNIPLGDTATLSLHGQARWRMESADNRDFNDDAADHDTFHLMRIRLGATLDVGEHFRASVTGQWSEAFMFDADPDPSTVEDHVDFLEYWLEARDLNGWNIRVGRQPLLFADQRLVGTFEWSNVARRFEGVRVYRRGVRWDFDAWWARVVTIQREKWNDWKQEEFAGLWLTDHGRDDLTSHAFFLARINNEGTTANERGGFGDDQVYTLGIRLEGDKAGWDWALQPAGQVGQRGGMDHLAWAFHGKLGYASEKLPWRPRLGVEYNFASGDADPADNDSSTFDQLFPTNHLHYGYLDLVGYRNIHNVKVELSAQPHPKLKLLAAWHAFWLHQRSDALYRANGSAALRDPTGSSGRYVGNEIDLLARYQINEWMSVTFGYSHFFAGSFVDSFAGRGDDADYFYVMWQMDI